MSGFSTGDFNPIRTVPMLGTHKTDAGNGSKAICRVIDASRLPSLDPGRSVKKLSLTS